MVLFFVMTLFYTRVDIESSVSPVSLPLLSNLPTATLRQPAPNAMLDLIHHRKLQAFTHNRTLLTHLTHPFCFTRMPPSFREIAGDTRLHCPSTQRMFLPIRSKVHEPFLEMVLMILQARKITAANVSQPTDAISHVDGSSRRRA